MRLAKARVALRSRAFVNRWLGKTKGSGIVKVKSLALRREISYIINEHLVVIILNYCIGRRCAGARS
jgi:hypothetical protein